MALKRIKFFIEFLILVFLKLIIFISFFAGVARAQGTPKVCIGLNITDGGAKESYCATFVGSNCLFSWNPYGDPCLAVDPFCNANLGGGCMNGIFWTSCSICAATTTTVSGVSSSSSTKIASSAVSTTTTITTIPTSSSSSSTSLSLSSMTLKSNVSTSTTPPLIITVSTSAPPQGSGRGSGSSQLYALFVLLLFIPLAVVLFMFTRKKKHQASVQALPVEMNSTRRPQVRSLLNPDQPQETTLFQKVSPLHSKSLHLDCSIPAPTFEPDGGEILNSTLIRVLHPLAEEAQIYLYSGPFSISRASLYRGPFTLGSRATTLRCVCIFADGSMSASSPPATFSVQSSPSHIDLISEEDSSSLENDRIVPLNPAVVDPERADRLTATNTKFSPSSPLRSGQHPNDKTAQVLDPFAIPRSSSSTNNIKPVDPFSKPLNLPKMSLGKKSSGGHLQLKPGGGGLPPLDHSPSQSTSLLLPTKQQSQEMNVEDLASDV